MRKDHQAYWPFTSRARLDKAINTLVGIVEGVAIDGHINEDELGYLDIWLREHRPYRDRHPFNEFIPLVESAVSDRVLTDEERDDIRWLAERLRSTDFYCQITADLQRLHALLGGILADGHVSEDELKGLGDWLDEHEHLRSCWPYDEIGALVSVVMADKVIDESEQQLLKGYFADFNANLDDRTITAAPILEGASIAGLCAIDPDVTFAEKGFCFTGASPRLKREEFEAIVERLGGTHYKTPSKKVHYLVIGSEGNPCWAFACYGRKVERAVELRRQGVRMAIVHEIDFHDAVESYR